MNCDFCGEELTDKGILANIGTLGKQWVCSDCFIAALITDRADIVHSWGYEKEEDEEEPVEVEDEKDDKPTGG